jgi:hypothetical protein
MVCQLLRHVMKLQAGAGSGMDLGIIYYTK